MAAMDDVLLFTLTQPQSQADVDSQIQVIRHTRDPIDLTNVGIPCCEKAKAEIKERRLNVKC